MKSKDSTSLAFDQIADALAAIRNGECVVVVDDESRENEGDLICAAQFATPQQINFMAKEARGLICLAMDGEKLDQLDLPLMVDRNTDSNQTAFTVSIDAGPEFGVSTGISAEDRARTIQVALSSKAKPSQLRRPGHVFPLRANKGGVLKRAGHTEAAVDLSQLSGLSAAGVICEIQNSDGSMARLPELRNYAKNWGLKIISIADLIKYRLENERFVYKKAETKLPSIFGDFQAIGYTNELDGTEHVALVKGKIGELKEPVLVRMHSECLTGDAFGSLRCDCRPQLEAALTRISQEGEGIVVYLRQEGRGIGLINKLRAYSLQDGGLDTVEANEKLGFPADLRNYGVGAQILTDLGINRLRLLTNNPRKIAGLGGYGLQVESREPLIIPPSDHNANYLEIKRQKLGHFIDQNQAQLADKFYVIYWDGDASAQRLSILRSQAEQLAKEDDIELIPESSSRLLALWERPQFVWRLKDCNRYKQVIKLLEIISKWDGTKRVGLLVSHSKEQSVHPSLNLRTEYNDITELQNYRKDFDKKTKELTPPFVIIWK